MKTKLFPIALFFILLGSLPATAQEFEVQVTVNDQKLSNQSDRDNLKGLDQAIREFVGLQKWTDDPTFSPENRIQLSLILMIETSSMGRKFTGQLFIGASRKIFRMDKPTTLFRYSDKNVEFDYYPGTQLVHNEQTFDPLPSLLNYYVYLILGIEADSYEPLGGTLYFARAHKIATMPGTSESIGWVSENTGEGRKLAVDEILDTKYQNFRNGFFKYHYDGLDVLHLNPDVAFEGITDALRLIQEVNQKYPNSLWRRRFFESKYKEIPDILKDFPTMQRLTVYSILSKADPSHLSEYQSLK